MTTGPERGGAPPLVVFTDLDGTLLHHHTYDWTPARPALAELARRSIPVVIATSKTRAEIEVWRYRLGIASPFISENGGALFIPPGDVPRVPAGAERRSGYLRIRYGEEYATLREALPILAREIGVPLRGFGDMEPREVAERTGLTGKDLDRACEREFDEPFVPARPLTPGEEVRLAERAASRAMRITRGGRFFHLTGPNSKGNAARALLSAYGGGDARVLSVALGDAANDLELLEAADHPIVVAGPDGTHAPVLRERMPRARFTRGIGPEGFNEGVLEILREAPPGGAAGAP